MRTAGVCALLVASLALAACGGSDSTQGTDPTTAPPPSTALVPVPVQPHRTLGRAALARAADANCSYENDVIRRLGVIGTTPEGVAAMYGGTLPVQQRVHQLQRRLRPVHALAKEWRTYLRTALRVLDFQRRLQFRASNIAGRGDPLPPGFFAPLQNVSRLTYKPADAIGLKVCTFTPKVRASGPGSKSVARAAHAYLSTAESKAGSVKLIGTAAYGPVGVAEINDPKGRENSTLVFVRGPEGALRYVADGSVPGGAIFPANPGNDAQAEMNAAVAAIRSGKSEGAARGEIVKAIKGNPDAKPVPLGQNQAFAFFSLETPGQKYVLMNTHQPGTESHYSGFSWWPVG